MRSLRISEVAARTGFSPTTLRYYEDVGLLPGLERSEAGYRLFDERSVRRLRLIARAKQLGLSLEEISELAGIWDRDECAPVQERLVALVTEKARAARERSGQLEAFASELEAAVADLTKRTAPGPCDEECGCTNPVATIPGHEAWVRIGRAPEPDPAQPIACTLERTAIVGRLDDWRAALAGAVEAERVDGGVRFQFAPDAEVATLAALAETEQRCCSF